MGTNTTKLRRSIGDPTKDSRDRRDGDSVRGRRRRRPLLEPLESRRLLSANVAEFPIRVDGGHPQGVASGAGSDKNVWFTLNSNNIGMINPNNTSAGVTQIPIPTYNSGPGPIAPGPDGNYWFFEETADQFGFINPSTGLITEIPLLSISDPQVEGITAGPNGYVWFTASGTSQIGAINTANRQITLFPTITPGAEPYGIVEGPDGNIWFTEAGTNQIGMLNPTTHAMQEFPIDSFGNDEAEGITAGPDHNLWITLAGTDKIAVMSPSTGALLQEYSVKTASAAPNSITLGPDSNLWFTESATDNLAMITTAGKVTELSTRSNAPFGITSGSDGNLWFVEVNSAGIASINPTSHIISGYGYAATAADNANVIVPDSGGNLWFTQRSDNQVGELNPTTGITTEFTSPTDSSRTLGIAVANGKIYYTEVGGPAVLFYTPGFKIGVVDPSSGTIQDFPTPTAYSDPYGIVYDPLGGDLWFTEAHADQIGRFDPRTNAMSEYSIPTANSNPQSIAVDPSGNVWFVEANAARIGVLNPNNPGSIQEYDVAFTPEGIVSDSSGNIWVSEAKDCCTFYLDEYNGSNGTLVNQYAVPSGHRASTLTLGPDGDIWFADSSGNIGTLTSNGTFTFYATAHAGPSGIASAADGNIWFTGTAINSNNTNYPNVIGVVTLSSTSNPTKLAVTTQPPGSVTATDGFGLVVAVENSAGNPDIDYTGTVTIALANNPGSDTLKGTLTATVNQGVAVFTGLTLKVPRSGYTITATASGLSSTATGAFNVTLGATQLVVTTEPPNSVQAGAVFGITVTAEDGLGNVDTSYVSAIALTLGNANGATLSGVVVVGANDGVATFTGLSLNLPGNDYVILASSGNLKSATSNGFDVTSGPPYQLAVASGGEPPSPVIAGQTFAVTIDALDQNGYLATTFNGSVTLAISNNSNVSLHGNVMGNAAGGVITFPGLSIDTVGSFTIAATSAGLLKATTSLINVTAGAATKLVVEPGNPPGTLVAGTQFGFVVDAEDQYSNIDPTFGAKVTIALVSGPSVTLHGSPDAFAQGGIASFSGLSIDTVGTYTIEATSGSLTPATTGSITITPAAPFKLVFATEPPQQVTAGQVFVPNPVIEVEDQFGNLETSDNRTVITAAPSAGSARLQGNSATVSGGIATFNNLIDTEAQTMMLQFAGGGLPPITSSAIDVLAGVASQLVVKRPPSGIVAGIGFPLEVDAQDTYTNLATSFNGSVSIGLVSGQGSLSGTLSVMAANGVANFTNLIDDTSGSISIGANATSGGNTISSPPSGSGPIVVNPGPVDHFVVTTTFANPDVAGTVGTVTVTAEDLNDNVVGSGPNQYEDLVGLVSTDPKTTGLPNSYAFTVSDAGTHIFTNVTLETAGSQTMTATDSVESTISGHVIVNVVPGQAHDFAIKTGFSDPDVAGTSATVTITAEDSYGNTAGSGTNQYLGTVNLVSTDPKMVGLPASYMFSASDAGSHTFASVILKTAGNQTITATDSINSALTSSRQITVTALPADQLVVVAQPPGTVAAGAGFSFEVVAEDTYSNIDTTFSKQVTVLIGTNPGGAVLSGTTTVPAASGVVQFSGLALSKVGIGYTLKVSSGTLTPSTTKQFSVTAPAPTVTSEKVVLAYPPTKKGKPPGAPIDWAYVLQYSGPMGTSAGNKSNYQVEAETTSHGKTSFTFVTFTETYRASKNTVTLTVKGKNPFTNGGKINILIPSKSGVSSQAGVLLNSKYTKFTISPGGNRITLG
jgi:streptogramin lyase